MSRRKLEEGSDKEKKGAHPFKEKQKTIEKIGTFTLTSILSLTPDITSSTRAEGGEGDRESFSERAARSDDNMPLSPDLSLPLSSLSPSSSSSLLLSSLKK